MIKKFFDAVGWVTGKASISKAVTVSSSQEWYFLQARRERNRSVCNPSPQRGSSMTLTSFTLGWIPNSYLFSTGQHSNVLQKYNRMKTMRKNISPRSECPKAVENFTEQNRKESNNTRPTCEMNLCRRCNKYWSTSWSLEYAKTSCCGSKSSRLLIRYRNDLRSWRNNTQLLTNFLFLVLLTTSHHLC